MPADKLRRLWHRAAKRTQAAGLAPGNPAFKQADLLNMGSTLGERQWDTALDSALLHCFPPETQQQYLRELHRHVSALCSGLTQLAADPENLYLLETRRLFCTQSAQVKSARLRLQHRRHQRCALV